MEASCGVRQRKVAETCFCICLSWSPPRLGVTPVLNSCCWHTSRAPHVWGTPCFCPCIFLFSNEKWVTLWLKNSTIIRNAEKAPKGRPARKATVPKRTARRSAQRRLKRCGSRGDPPGKPRFRSEPRAAGVGRGRKEFFLKIHFGNAGFACNATIGCVTLLVGSRRVSDSQDLFFFFYIYIRR